MNARALSLCLLLAGTVSLPAGQITLKTQNYINYPGTVQSQTIAVSYQLFTGSTDCTSGGGAVTTATGINSTTGFTFDTGGATSLRLVADPNGDPSYARSEQNGPFVSWSPAPGETSTFVGSVDRTVCISGFTTNTYFANLYVGIQAFDACGNERSTFAPGETVYFRFAGGVTFNGEPHRVLAAGGSPNECTFLPEAPLFTTIHITSDPQIVPLTLPSSDAAILPSCASSGTTSITGNWRVVAYDVPGCGCNRNQLNFTVEAGAIPGCAITCPADVSVTADAGACGANVSFTPPSGPGTVTCDRASGSFFDLGTTTVTCTSSLGSSCSFDVEVTDDEDPVLTAPADVDATADSTCTATTAVGTATGSDNCGAPAIAGVRDDAQPLASPYPLGTTTITWTATDAAGNSASDVQTVNVTAAPLEASAAASPQALWPPNHKLVPVTITSAATGGCGAVTCAITGVTSNQPVFGPGQHKDPDWIIDGPTQVRLRPERTQGQPRVYTITVSCSDGSGQTETKEVTVVVDGPK
jgi:hypothetical protein